MRKPLWGLLVLLAILVIVGMVRLAQHTAVSSRPTARRGVETYISTNTIRAQHAREQQQGLHYRKLIRGNPALPMIALTFDDGPHPRYTPQLLAILAKYRVPATFFVVGEMAERYPALLQAECAAGHLIGNHTYHHINLTKYPPEQVKAEWDACDQVVQRMLGYRMRYCRPPGGDYDATVINEAMACGLTTVLWTDDPGDYAQPGSRILIYRTEKYLRNGGIILLHDGVGETITILPQLIEDAQRLGYHFVTLDTMEQYLRQPARPRQLTKQRHYYDNIIRI